jgi:hypothetical protein
VKEDYGENFLDPHLDALRVIVTATDDEKGRNFACWNNYTGLTGSSVLLFAPDPSDTTLSQRWDGVPRRLTPSLSLFSLGCENLPQSSANREPVRSSAV